MIRNMVFGKDDHGGYIIVGDQDHYIYIYRMIMVGVLLLVVRTIRMIMVGIIVGDQDH